MKSSNPLAGSNAVICRGGSVRIVGVSLSSGTFRAARKAAEARSGRSPASKTMARTSPPNRVCSTIATKSSQRSSVRTSDPSCRSIAAAPSAPSTSARWPTTNTNAPGFPTVAPLHIVRGVSREALTDARSSDCDRRDLHRRTADAHGYALAVLAAGPDAVADLDVAPEERHPAEHVRPVSDEIHSFERGRDFPVLHEVALRQGKDEVAVGDVDLPSAELLRVDAALHAL